MITSGPDRLTLLTRHDRQLPLVFELFTNFRFQNTEYDETDPLYISNRRDNVFDLSCSLSKRLWLTEDKNAITAEMNCAFRP